VIFRNISGENAYPYRIFLMSVSCKRLSAAISAIHQPVNTPPAHFPAIFSTNGIKLAYIYDKKQHSDNVKQKDVIRIRNLPRRAVN
jgi:hypothetical protein